MKLRTAILAVTVLASIAAPAMASSSDIEAAERQGAKAVEEAHAFARESMRQRQAKETTATLPKQPSNQSQVGVHFITYVRPRFGWHERALHRHRPRWDTGLRNHRLHAQRRDAGDPIPSDC